MALATRPHALISLLAASGGTHSTRLAPASAVVERQPSRRSRAEIIHFLPISLQFLLRQLTAGSLRNFIKSCRWKPRTSAFADQQM